MMTDPTPQTTLQDDAILAAHIARTAGEVLLTLRRGPLDGKALGAAGDAAANAFIVRALTTLRPEDGLLSEEAVDSEARLGKRRVWIVDPLDGTREYAEGREDWAVHVGLAVDGVAVAGAVALPATGLVLDTANAPALADAQGLRMIVSRTRPPAEALAVAQALGAELVPMGSAGAKAMAVVRAQAEIYLHSGGQWEWDNCAPAAVAAAAGLHVSRIDGSPLRYNAAHPYLPDLLICRPELADRVLALVAAL